MSSSESRHQNKLRRRRKGQIRHERNKLFSSNEKDYHKHKKNSSSAAEDAKNITSSLLRTKSLLTQELDRVTSLNQTIDEDNSKLLETSSDHTFLVNVVSGARGALRKLKSQDHRDSVVLFSSAIFFYTVVLYVVWTRIRIPYFLW